MLRVIIKLPSRMARGLIALYKKFISPLLPPAELFLPGEDCFARLKQWPRVVVSTEDLDPGVGRERNPEIFRSQHHLPPAGKVLDQPFLGAVY